MAKPTLYVSRSSPMTILTLVYTSRPVVGFLDARDVALLMSCSRGCNKTYGALPKAVSGSLTNVMRHNPALVRHADIHAENDSAVDLAAFGKMETLHLVTNGGDVTLPPHLRALDFRMHPSTRIAELPRTLRSLSMKNLPSALASQLSECSDLEVLDLRGNCATDGMRLPCKLRALYLPGPLGPETTLPASLLSLRCGAQTFPDNLPAQLHTLCVWTKGTGPLGALPDSVRDLTVQSKDRNERSLELPRFLQSLKLPDATRIAKLQTAVPKTLAELDFDGSDILPDTPNSIRTLRMVIGDDTKFDTALAAKCPNVRELELQIQRRSFEHFHALPLSNLERLTVSAPRANFDVSSCENLSSLAIVGSCVDLANLPVGLQHLKIDHFPFEAHALPLSNLERLTVSAPRANFDVSSCENLSSLAIVGSCVDLANLPVGLQHLKIDHFPFEAHASLLHLDRLPNLVSLDINFACSPGGICPKSPECPDTCQPDKWTWACGSLFRNLGRLSLTRCSVDPGAAFVCGSHPQTTSVCATNWQSIDIVNLG